MKYYVAATALFGLTSLAALGTAHADTTTRCRKDSAGNTICRSEHREPGQRTKHCTKTCREDSAKNTVCRETCR